MQVIALVPFVMYSYIPRTGRPRDSADTAHSFPLPAAHPNLVGLERFTVVMRRVGRCTVNLNTNSN